MTCSELDNLKSVWQSLHRRLDREQALALHQFRTTKLERFRSVFRPLIAGQIIQFNCGMVLALAGLFFGLSHLGVAHLIIYGFFLQSYGLMLVSFAARDLFLVRRIDYSAAVLPLQRQLAELHRWHCRISPWLAVAGCFMWIPTTLILFYGAGIDVWQGRPDVVGWCVLGSLGFMGGVYGTFYGLLLWARHSRRKQLVQTLENSAGGRSVRQARALLDEISQFENE